MGIVYQECAGCQAGIAAHLRNNAASDRKQSGFAVLDCYGVYGNIFQRECQAISEKYNA